jgi:hypothetical protein
MSTVDVEITIQRRGRRRPRAAQVAALRIPRITRLMALAIKFQDMIDRGEVRDYADIARLGYVTRARVTQIMNLLNLAPEIQENLLELSGDTGGHASRKSGHWRRLLTGRSKSKRGVMSVAKPSCSRLASRLSNIDQRVSQGARRAIMVRTAVLGVNLHLSCRRIPQESEAALSGLAIPANLLRGKNKDERDYFRMLRKVTAVQFHRFLDTGRTHPALFACVDDDGQAVGDYVVKLRARIDTREKGAASELIASCLAKHFGIKRPEPIAALIQPDLVDLLARKFPAEATLLRDSRGLNFGCAYLTDVSVWPIPRALPDAMLNGAAAIFAFDALISNDDRRYNNQNVLIRGDDIYVIDHEAAFSFLYLLGLNDKPWEVANRRSLSDHVFFFHLRKQPVNLQDFVRRLASLGDTELELIVQEVPSDWRHDGMDRICSHLKCVRDNAEKFERQILERLL